jgi:uncharacterized membrane protein
MTCGKARAGRDVTDETQNRIAANDDLFEMRRLESLSNTIFGVAMTLLAYDAPKAGHFTGPPDWSDLYHAYAGRLSGLALSFIIAGIFWFSHHRRLARQPYGSRVVVIINLIFLLTIILLPVTNGLYANYGMSGAVAVVYGLHLTAIASLNALLWWLATRGSLHHELAGSMFSVLVILLGTIVAWFAPQDAQYFWFLAFGGMAMRRFFRGKQS